ncbi:hypothetical protein Droror1_Dr00026151 [Drosera rotundifolia]
MAFPSSIHHAQLRSLKSTPLLTAIAELPHHSRHPNHCRFNNHFSQTRILHSGINCRGWCHGFTIQCSEKESEVDDVGLSISSAWETSSPSSDENDSKISTNVPTSVGYTENYLFSARTVALWVSSAVIFGIGLGFKEGADKASEFFAGYILEQSLSVDNLFVFVLIFKYFKVPAEYENKVLSYGIAGAVIFRLSLILLGTATLQRFEAVNLLLAAVLLYSAFKLLGGDEEEDDFSNNFVVKTCQRFIPVAANYDGDRFFTIQGGIRKATPLLLTVAVLELSDIAFAVDSIPAVFGVTRDPFIVFTSNLFAISGLRSLYTLVSEGMSQLEYLQPSIAVVLGFIGCKMILDFFGYHVTTEASLGFVATSLTAGVVLSLMKKSK